MKTHFPYTIALVFLLLIGSHSTFAQKKKVLDGVWEGHITQKDGELGSNFEFELWIQQKGKKITGRSYARIDDIHAVMEFKGKLMARSSIVVIEETKIIEAERIKDMDWCIKTLQLIFQYDKKKGLYKLDGYWQGASKYGVCKPGKVHLTRKIPRA